jgi:hypothetical protein
LACREKASYGTVHAMHRQWSAGRAVPIEAPAPAQQALSLGASEATPDQREEREAMATPASVEVAPAGGAHGETTLDEVAPPAGSVVQHLGSWLLLGGLRELGFYGLADQHRSDAVAMPSLRTAIDAAAIALALGEFCVEGVRRLTTPSMETLLRHVGGVSASWVRRVLHDFADVGSKTFPGAMASRLLQRTGEGDDRVWLYVDGHMRPYTGQHVIRKGWRMQDKRAVPGTTDYYVYRDGAVMLSMLAESGDLASRAVQRST